MSRIIKFRAWDGTQMHDRDDMTVRFIGDKCYVSLPPPYGDIACTPLEFTGRHDKNGRRILEGDIVRYFSCQNEKGEVWLHKPGYPAPLSWIGEYVFEDGGFGIKRRYCEGNEGAAWQPWSFFAENGSDEEVIGNVYENPELLNKKV